MAGGSVRDSPRVEAARQWVIALTSRGEDLGSVVRKGGKRFEEFERSLLTLGDESGSLEESLRLLAEFYERKHRLILKVKKQMAYPMYTMLLASFIGPFPLLFFGHTLLYLASVGSSLAWLVLFGGALLLGVANRYGRKPALVRARFARALATGIEAGLPLGRSLRLAANASADAQLVAYMTSIDDRTLSTTALAETMVSCPHMTPDLLAVIQVAERTGNFTHSLRKLADLYEDGFR